MITKAPQNNQVTPDMIENREAEQRPIGKATSAAAELAAVKGELAELKARIEAARQLKPQAHERHCLDCFQKGRNAAIRAIVGET